MRPLPSLLLLASLGLQAQEDPIALMFQARAHQVRHGGDQPQKAVDLYQKVIALVPRSAEAHLRLAEAHAEMGNLEAAAGAAQTAAALAPQNGEAWSILGLIHYFRGRTRPEAWDQAKTALQRASRLLPGDPDLLLRLAEVCEGRKDDALGADTWLRLGRLRPTMVMQGRPLLEIAFERAALLASKTRDFDIRREAVMALCLRSEADPRHLRLLEELARDQVDQGFLGHAEDSFRILAGHVPKEPAAWENLALVQLQTSRYAEALGSLQKARALRPGPSLTVNEGFCLMRLNRLPEAETRLREALGSLKEDDRGTQPTLLRARILLASLLLMDGRPEACLDLLKTWPRVEAQADLASLKIQALVQTRAWKPAQTLLKDGLGRFKETGLFHLASLLPRPVLEGGLFRGRSLRSALVGMDREAMAGLFAEHEQWARCLDLLAEARAAGPVRDVELYLLQANALDRLGRPKEALAVLREGQKLAPDHPVLQNNLGYSLLELGGDLAEAERLIRAALAKEPENGSTLDSFGWLLHLQGRHKEAEVQLRRALERTPYSPEIHRHLGEALLKQGRLDDAIAQFERALAYSFPDRAALETRVKALRLESARKRTPLAETPVVEDRNDDEELP